MSKIPKSAAGYVHFDNTQYHCRDCYKWTNRSQPQTCADVAGTIKAIGGCNTFVFGRVEVMPVPNTKLTQLEAGYVENRQGFSCKRCNYFDRENWDCKVVDKDSPGTDRGIIAAEACCNHWEKSKVFGEI